MRRLLSLILIGSLTFLAGCTDHSEQSYGPVFVENNTSLKHYRFAIHPLHNPTRLYEVFSPLIDYLNQNIQGVVFSLEASESYADFNKKLQNQSVDFALPNPYQTLLAIDKGYQVIAKMGDDENFKGIFLVRKDSHIKFPRDLKGKVVSYPAPTALAATMLPQDYLQQNGINVSTDIVNKYVGSQESSIMNVFVGASAAGATWPPPWKALSDQRPELKKELKVIWQTQSLPNNSIVARSDVPLQLIKQVQRLLSNLHKVEAGQKILKAMYLSKFELADNATYLPVQKFIEHFNETVRPLNP
jgi:phosphonate transport system substrate-binding protein